MQVKKYTLKMNIYTKFCIFFLFTNFISCTIIVIKLKRDAVFKKVFGKEDVHMIKAGIIGATGYAGAEIVRILMNHKEVEIAWFGSRSYIDQNYADIYSNFFQIVDAKCMDDNMEELAASVDVIFTATPQGFLAGVLTEEILNKVKIIDLSADFRIKEEEARLLSGYSRAVHWKDETNREGHAAKVYFNALFGMDFSRSQDNNINAALNYGYSILLSAFNREIVANGYITQLGLFHDNMFNQFNFGSDLMEPFRILIDRIVYNMNLIDFEHEQKMKLVNVLNGEVYMEGKHFIVNNAIKRYTKSVFDAINDSDISLLRFYSVDEL